MLFERNLLAPKLAEVVYVTLDPLLELVHGFSKVIICRVFYCDLVDHTSLYALFSVDALSPDFLISSSSAGILSLVH